MIMEIDFEQTEVGWVAYSPQLHCVGNGTSQIEALRNLCDEAPSLCIALGKADIDRSPTTQAILQSLRSFVLPIGTGWVSPSDGILRQWNGTEWEQCYDEPRRRD